VKEAEAVGTWKQWLQRKQEWAEAAASLVEEAKAWAEEAEEAEAAADEAAGVVKAAEKAADKAERRWMRLQSRGIVFGDDEDAEEEAEVSRAYANQLSHDAEKAQEHAEGLRVKADDAEADLALAQSYLALMVAEEAEAQRGDRLRKEHEAKQKELKRKQAQAPAVPSAGDSNPRNLVSSHRAAWCPGFVVSLDPPPPSLRALAHTP
jgi:hypothetical protein